MPIQQPDRTVESKQPFPANENSTYPPKSTVRVIVSLTLGIAVLVMLFALSANHPTLRQTGAPAPSLSTMQQPNSNIGRTGPGYNP